MPLRNFPNFNLIMSCHRKVLRGALGHGQCANPSLVDCNLRVSKLAPVLCKPKSHFLILAVIRNVLSFNLYR